MFISDQINKYSYKRNITEFSFSPYGFPTHTTNRQNTPMLLDYSDIHVFDFEPTLKTLALRAVLDFEIDQSLLPQCIR